MPQGTCSIAGCEKASYCRGWCSLHYQRWRRHDDPLMIQTRAICVVEGCDRFVRGHDLCNLHYKRWKAHGDPMRVDPSGKQRAPVAERFWSKVNKDGPVPENYPELGPCWIWEGGALEGYGRFSLPGHRGPSVAAHRFAYELVVGGIPEGLQLDHLCRVRRCVNPGHLEPVTRRANIMRGLGVAAVNARKTRCSEGHAFTAENTYVRPDGIRVCKTCRREYKRGWSPPVAR